MGFTFIQTLLLQNILMVNLRHPKMILFFSLFLNKGMHGQTKKGIDRQMNGWTDR